MTVKSDTLIEFENHLQTSLRPVNPDARFVTHLRDRLVIPPVTVYEEEPDPERVLAAIGLALLVLFGGLITGLGLLTLKRAIFK
ncbi:MAG TPA: hypothetical protein VMT46_19570 [Anaerolineaceae bacterium]|nr:hypothetical protein [Anaerolineaceae bacterium]